MTRKPVDPRIYAGYTATDVRLEDMRFQRYWVVVEEELETLGLPAGLIAVQKKNTTVGRVLAVGAKAEEDIRAGDRILFTEWQGAKWAFLKQDGSKVNVLIMDESYVQARIGNER